MKILFVEDNFILQKMYAIKFRDAGFTIVLASNGRECLDKAIREKPDFILLDLKMPGIDGVEALRYLKKHEATQDIPVAIFTELEGEPEETIKDQILIKLLAAYWKKEQLAPDTMIENVKKILNVQS